MPYQNNKTNKKKQYITLRISVNLHKKLWDIAKSEQRTIEKVSNRLMAEAVDAYFLSLASSNTKTSGMPALDAKPSLVSKASSLVASQKLNNQSVIQHGQQIV